MKNCKAFFLFALMLIWGTALFGKEAKNNGYEVLGEKPIAHSYSQISYQVFFDFDCVKCFDFLLMNPPSRIDEIDYQLIPVYFSYLGQNDKPSRFFYVAQSLNQTRKALYLLGQVVRGEIPEYSGVFHEETLVALAKSMDIEKEYLELKDSETITAQVQAGIQLYQDYENFFTPTVILGDKLRFVLGKDISRFSQMIEFGMNLLLEKKSE